MPDRAGLGPDRGGLGAGWRNEWISNVLLKGLSSPKDNENRNADTVYIQKHKDALATLA